MIHAWLIIAHNEFGILQRLISMLDAPECNFFVHIDKKVKDLPVLNVAQGRLHLLENREDVRWGTVSQIRCELALLDAAAGAGTFDYYHIISGTTLPLKPFRWIDNYFSLHEGKCICSGLCQDTPYQETLKVRRYNLFLSCPFLWKSAIAVQRMLHIETNRGKSFYTASNWLSLTEDAVRYLLARKEEILKTYRYSFCGDEFFIPSELMESPLKDSLISDEKYLFHDISRANAATWRLDEYEALKEKDCLFARKFTES